MSALVRHVIIDAPADTVWEVIAGRFDRIGEWAAAIPASTIGIPDPGLIDLGAPVATRVCETGIGAMPKITETIVAFDAAGRRLTYQVTDGVPAFVTAARNTWTVAAVSTTRCRVDITAEFATRGLLGRLARPLMLARVLRDGRFLLDDLKYYVETGAPSPRKQARLRRQNARPPSIARTASDRER